MKIVKAHQQREAYECGEQRGHDVRADPMAVAGWLHDGEEEVSDECAETEQRVRVRTHAQAAQRHLRAAYAHRLARQQVALKVLVKLRPVPEGAIGEVIRFHEARVWAIGVPVDAVFQVKNGEKVTILSN